MILILTKSLDVYAYRHISYCPFSFLIWLISNSSGIAHHSNLSFIALILKHFSQILYNFDVFWFWFSRIVLLIWRSFCNSGFKLNKLFSSWFNSSSICLVSSSLSWSNILKNFKLNWLLNYSSCFLNWSIVLLISLLRSFNTSLLSLT